MFGNTNTPTFGTSGLFGQAQQSQQQQPQQTSGVTSFGGWTTTGTNVFGTSNSPTTNNPSVFGQATGGGIFGGQAQTQQSAMSTATQGTTFFGSGTTTNAGSPGFTTGSPGSTGYFGTSSPTTNSAGTPIRFETVKEHDTINTKGVAQKITVQYQCITIMAQYKNKSLEELRLEDYQLNRHKKTGSTNLFSGIGTSSPTTPPVAPSPPTGGLFGSLLGNQQQQQSQWPSLSTNTNNTGATTAGSGNLFSNLFKPAAAQQNSTTTNLFGTQSPFGSSAMSTGGSTTPTTPFSFTGIGTTNPQQGQGQTTSIFGSPQSSTAAKTPAFTFGQNTSGTTSGGTLNLVGNQNQQQAQTQPQNNGFNFTVAASQVNTTGPGASMFGAPSTNSSNTASKPLFGGSTTTPAAPTTNSFGSTGFFGNTNNTTTTGNKTVTFGSTTTAPAFGSTALGTLSSTVPVAGTSTRQQQPSTTFGFNATSTQPAALSTTNISFGAPSQSTTGMFGTTGSSVKLATAPGTFGSTGGFVLQAPLPVQLQAPKMPMYQHPQYVNPGPVTFGTSAFKDSPLFYNMHENVPAPKAGQRRKRLEMPPADESIPKYVPKSSSDHIWPRNFTSLPLFRRKTSLVKGKNSSISKFKIFDGFEEEDLGVGIDILSPKTDVKRLNLQALEESLGSLFPLSNNATEKPTSTLPSSSSSLARISTELLLVKNSEDIPPKSGGAEVQQACSSTSVLGNRRVRFLLPPAPGQEKDDDDLGSHFGSSSVSLLDASACFGGGGGVGGGGAGDCAFLRGSSSDESIVGIGGGVRSDTSLVKFGSGCGLVSSRDSYYVKPRLEQLDKLVDKEGNCFVEGFEVGRKNFGRIKFLCPVNVKNVNIDQLVNFRHKEVVVYPDDGKKPEIGQGLNVPAEIRLERVWPVDKETNELIRGVDNIKQLNYEERLRRSCKRMGVQFISYEAEDGIWSFRVDHF